jgi:hypothetical protein
LLIVEVEEVDWKIIDGNPFLKVKTQNSSVKVNEFVPREVVDELMKKANPGWPRLFHSVKLQEGRASRQTELQREFPLHVICSWLGNSPRF